MAHRTGTNSIDLRTDEAADRFDMDFRENIIAKFSVLYETQALCDVTLIAGMDNQRISAHRAWLAAASPYFHVMFTGNFMDKDKDEVVLNEIHGSPLKALIDYCYTGRIDINETNASILLETASRLEFPTVETKCAEFFRKSLAVSNCLSIWTEIEPFINLKELAEAALMLVEQNFGTIVARCEDFLLLDKELLLKLLMRDKLNVLSEEQVFNALMKWIEYDEINRKSEIPSLLSAIRMIHIETEFLHRVVEMFCKKYDFCHVADEMRKWKSLRRRKPTIVKRLLAFGNDHHSVIGARFSEIYCPILGQWKMFDKIHLDRTDFASVVIDDELIVMGGRNHGNSVQKFNFITGEATELEPMLTGRAWFGAAILDNNIYVAGGENCQTAERYDLATGRWYPIPLMNGERKCYPLVACAGKLYAVGGVRGRAGRGWASVDCYDPLTNRWELIPPMTHERCSHPAFAHKNQLYVIGGHNERFNAAEPSCEFYDPVTRRWTVIENLRVPRWGHRIVVYDDYFLVVGGAFTGNILQSTVIKLNFDTFTQQPYPAMQIPRNLFGLAEVNIYDPNGIYN